ncbi:HTH-type transcriptional regulator MalT [Baekduia alba]|uniref:BTAD domain-containing putative transcriptional regulator n=1 Tax=Baekduia alba TaxID=2997333 RepID=UPI002341ACE9|nr:BTAD domain-containing putative transcriptional regulator [Baekduia alba]WCB95279.1 HTH-type transcriptional regulator MalT [Baekduia alba]
MIIRTKLKPPGGPTRFVPRPRVDELLRGLIDRHQIVWIAATAGSGKTTAVVEAARGAGRPLAWLTLDQTERAPGRLLAYLAAALAPHVPDAEELVQSTLQLGTPHQEVAGLLADALPEEPLLVVVDQVEHLADAAGGRRVLSALIRYAPSAARFVLVSRAEVELDLGSASWTGGVAAVGERDLAFDADEAAEALRAVGGAAIDPETAVRVTGGWVTGVLFESWRAADHVYGSGGEADPLHGYLAQHIMSTLAPAEHELLVRAAVLRAVDADAAEALGVAHAGALLASLRGKHLPVIWEGGGAVLQPHPRFREYLLTLLGRRSREEQLAIHRAHAELLLARGEREEATEALLRAHMPDRAASAAEDVIHAVVERHDLEQATRWLDAFGGDRVRRSERLMAAELLVAVGTERYGDGAAIADRLRARRRSGDPPLEARLACFIAWCYMMVVRFDDGLAVLDDAVPGPEVDIARSVLLTELPGGHYAQLAPPSGGPVDALLQRSYWAYGRLTRLLAEPPSPWAAAVNKPWRVAALRALGRLPEALALYEESMASGWGSTWLTASVHMEVMAELGRADEAWQVYAERRPSLEATGSHRLVLFADTLEAKLALRVDRDLERARAALDRMAADPATQQIVIVREQMLLWQGLRLLLSGEDDAAALASLTTAVALMAGADRILELPSAAVYLSEAQWRTGDPEAADRAADLALDAARRQGSHHSMLKALADFPAVASRRLDSGPSDDAAWRDLGRALLQGPAASGAGRPSAPRRRGVVIGDLGRRVLLVDGRETRPRIAKSIDLLAFLATRSDQSAGRAQLLDVLFDGRADDSSRAYLRQALSRAREVLPPPYALSSENGTVAVTGGALVSDSTELLTALDTAASLEGPAALAGLRVALADHGERELLPGGETEWIAERRRRLAAAVVDARLRAGTIAHDLGEYADAESYAKAVLRDDPYREQAWRLLMRARSAMGDDDGMLRAYQGCREALGALDAEPARSTQQLLEQLRR